MDNGLFLPGVRWRWMALRRGAAGSCGLAAALMAIPLVRALAISLAHFCLCASRVLALPVPCVTAHDQRQGHGPRLTRGPNEPDQPVLAGAALNAMLRYRLRA